MIPAVSSRAVFYFFLNCFFLLSLENAPALSKTCIRGSDFPQPSAHQPIQQLKEELARLFAHRYDQNASAPSHTLWDGLTPIDTFWAGPTAGTERGIAMFSAGDGATEQRPYVRATGSTRAPINSDGWAEYAGLNQRAQFDWMFTDHLGSTAAFANFQGVVSGGLAHGAWGEALEGAFGKTSMTYAGTQRDGGAGLQYAWHRFYDPTQGRFVSRDPIGFQDGLNLYAYVSNNPVNLTDPWGLWEWGGKDGVLERLLSVDAGKVALDRWKGYVGTDVPADEKLGLFRSPKVGERPMWRLDIRGSLNNETAAGVFVHEATHAEQHRKRLGTCGWVQKEGVIDTETEGENSRLEFHKQRMVANLNQALEDGLSEVRRTRLETDSTQTMKNVVESLYYGGTDAQRQGEHFRDYHYDYHYKYLKDLIYKNRNIGGPSAVYYEPVTTQGVWK